MNEKSLTTDERSYKDPWSRSLYNCTTGANYLRGGEYLHLIEHLEKLQIDKEGLLEALRNLVDWQAEISHAVPLTYLDAAKAAIAKAEGRSNG